METRAFDDGFDDLAKDALFGPNKMADQALWRAALNLDEWYFVASFPGSEADGPEPLVAAIEGTPHLLAFTNEARAQAMASRFAQAKGLDTGETLVMDVPDAVDYAAQLRELEVAGIHFNDGEHGFTCGLDDLAVRARQYRS